MAFQTGSYAKIKTIENKGNYTSAKIVISKKVRGTDKYVCDFAGWVTFIGDAHKCRPMEGQKIKIGSCEVSNGYLDASGNQQFCQKPQFKIYSYELQDGVAGSPVPQPNWTDIAEEDGLPF